MAMTVEKGPRPTSPVHVHVEDDTPVHVHVKKTTKKAASAKAIDVVGKSENARKSRPRHSTVKTKSKSRSQSPGGGGPWVPPPGKTTKGTKISWNGPSHRLEINTPGKDSLRMADLSTDEEDLVHGQMKNYENKIANLMTEVGTLKNEAELQKSIQELSRKDKLLESSRRVLEEQESELMEYQQELDVTERENRILRKSMDLLKEEVDINRTERDELSSESERLMKKLIEVEMDGQAAAKQVAELREFLKKKEDSTTSSMMTSARLSKEKDLLLQKLTDFEATNRTLRRLLRDQHRQESGAVRLIEQRDVLMRKLTDSETTTERLRSELIGKDRLINDLRAQVSSQKEETMALTSLQTSLETTRAHLQKQLRSKEADCNRMAVQIRTLEGDLAQTRIECEHLTELLSTAREKGDRDKEALKKATRAQKQRATRSEDALEQVKAQLLERENQLADIEASTSQDRARIEKSNKEKSQLQSENTRLQLRVQEVERLLDRVEESTKSQTDGLAVQLHDKSSELSTLRLDNERLRSTVTSLESKVSQNDEEVDQLRVNLRQYENLVDEYRSQFLDYSIKYPDRPLPHFLRNFFPRMNRSRRDADDAMSRLEETELENSRLQRDGEMELDRVKQRLQQRLQELDPLPEMLKTTELKLHESSERMLVYERKNAENTKLISELTAKVEIQSDQLEQLRDKLQNAQDDYKTASGKLELVERKLHESEDQIHQLMSTVTKREETIHQHTLLLEEKTHEVSSLTRQLENALGDARRQEAQNRDRLSTKERTLQSRIMDLESQLSQTRAEIARIKREKEENERKFNSRLYDLKDRLEQSHSTNRSMQNYVQFLKNSYANVFGETTLGTSSPLRSGLP